MLCSSHASPSSLARATQTFSGNTSVTITLKEKVKKKDRQRNFSFITLEYKIIYSFFGEKHADGPEVKGKRSFALFHSLPMPSLSYCNTCSYLKNQRRTGRSRRYFFLFAAVRAVPEHLPLSNKHLLLRIKYFFVLSGKKFLTLLSSGRCTLEANEKMLRRRTPQPLSTISEGRL
jgi:hypothetical protein